MLDSVLKHGSLRKCNSVVVLEVRVGNRKEDCSGVKLVCADLLSCLGLGT